MKVEQEKLNGKIYEQMQEIHTTPKKRSSAETQPHTSSTNNKVSNITAQNWNTVQQTH